MARAKQLLPSPPPDFPVYGVDSSWPGPRWLESYGDLIGGEVRWVRLAHGHPDSGSLIEVETHSRSLTDAQARRSREPSLRTVAFGVANVLVNLTLPANSVPRPPGLIRALARHGCEQSERYAEWPSTYLRVGDVPVMASIWRFADGWAAVSDAVPGVYLAVAGLAIDPGGIELAELRDGGAYNFDLGQPLHPRVIAASAAAAACEIERPQHWHDDQLRLIHEAGQ